MIENDGVAVQNRSENDPMTSNDPKIHSEHLHTSLGVHRDRSEMILRFFDRWTVRILRDLSQSFTEVPETSDLFFRFNIPEKHLPLSSIL